MVTSTFYDSKCSRITDSKTFTCPSMDVNTPTSGTIKAGVARNHLVKQEEQEEEEEKVMEEG